MTAKFARIPARTASIQILGAQDLRALIALATHADKEGRAFPGLDLIATTIGADRRNVSRSMRRIEEAGVIRRTPRKAPNGGWDSTMYTILFEPSEPEQEEMCEQTIDRAAEQRRKEDRAVAESMLAIWKQECGDALVVPRSLDRDRVSACHARFRDSFGQDLQQWRAYIREILASPFLRGEKEGSSWKANIDWALKPSNIRKVREGNYRDEQPRPRVRPNGTYGIPPLGPGGT